MNSIRTSFKQTNQVPSASDVWTNLRLAVVPFINANADVFRALSRMGAPFGEGLRSR